MFLGRVQRKHGGLSWRKKSILKSPEAEETITRVLHIKENCKPKVFTGDVYIFFKSSVKHL